MRHHPFHKTTIEHHKDNSHTITHHHDAGPEHNVTGATADHDGMIDHIMDHTAPPNPGEAAADMGQHGVPAPMAAPAGLPAMPGPAGQ